MNIVFVCQRGQLEIKSVLLAWSLRKFLKNNCDITAAVPNYMDWGNLSSETETVLAKLNVRCVNFIPTFGSEYPIGNKIDALGLLGDDRPGCFIDTDMLCLAPWNLDALIEHVDVLAKPADMSTWGSDKLWEDIYTQMGLPAPERRVRLTVNEKLSWPYFNAGFVVAKTPKALASAWMAIAKNLNNSESLENKFPWLDQITLPIAIQQCHQNSWKCLEEKYNFPGHLRSLAQKEIALCHYHSPGVILREPRLYELCNEFLHAFPEFKQTFNLHAEWKSLSQPKFPQVVNYEEKRRNFIITGIPRSGTSYVSTLLHSQENWVVINEPAEIFEELQNRTDASGIAAYHAGCREKILAGYPIPNKMKSGVLIQDTAIEDVRELYHPKINSHDFHLGSKNTLAYMAALSNLIELEWPIVAMVRNPIDTLTSWRKTFAHLKKAMPSDLPIANPSYHGWNASQRSCLREIDQQNDERLRRVLLWRLLAKTLIDHHEKILLFRYEDVVQTPTLIQEKLNKLMSYENYERISGSEYRNRTNDHDDIEKEMLVDLCGNELKALGYLL